MLGSAPIPKDDLLIIFLSWTVVILLIILAVLIYTRRKQRRAELQAAQELERSTQERTEALRDAIKHLQQLDEVKSEFISLASHQLRTPLTGLRWAQQALLEEAGELSEDHKKILDAALERITYMTRLVNELLDVTRIEDQQFQLVREDSNIVDLVRDIAEQFRGDSKRRGLKYSVHTPSEKIIFPIDKEKFTMAFGNIIDNAIKYTPKGGSVSVELEADEQEVTITITDTGIGIPKKDLYRVFSKFWRATNALSMYTTGSGLGLYITKKIVEKHGGSVSVASEVGKGSTFIIKLPRQAENDS